MRGFQTAGLVAGAGLLAACPSLTDLSGTLCNPGGTCGPGYFCEAATNHCVAGQAPDAGLALLQILSGSATNFGLVAKGFTSDAGVITLENVGTLGTGFLSTALDGGPGFVLQQDHCTGLSLDAGQQCSITATFSPTAGGAASASLSFSASPGGTVAASLSGIGGVPLTVTLTGSGAGTVTGANGGIACPGTCTVAVAPGSTDSLTATADAGSTFTGWSGCTSATGPSCTINVDGGATVSASFAISSVELNEGVVPTNGGTIQANPGGTSCGFDCLAFNYGTNVQLTALADAGIYFAGWTGACADAGLSSTCSLTLTGNAATAATFGPANLVFVSSKTYAAGSIGSEDNANLECTNMAAAATPKVIGAFKAWLSYSTLNATDPSRWGTSRGWVRQDGKPFADTLQALTQLGRAQLFYPLRLDENGNDLSSGGTAVSVATGTNPGGTYATGFNCNDWTSSLGTDDILFGANEGGAGGLWTYAATSTCNFPALHIYCFQADHAATVHPPPPNGRILFITSSPFDPSTGLGAADTLCQNQAKSAGLPDAGLTGAYQALLATSAGSAMSRFSAAWHKPLLRPDGVQLAPLDDVLYAGGTPSFAAPTNVSADGYTEWTDNSYTSAAWAGASSLTVVAGPSDNCSDWASKSGTSINGQGDHSAGTVWWNATTHPCSDSTFVALYCLEN
jgi:hypothetical protein